MKLKFLIFILSLVNDIYLLTFDEDETKNYREIQCKLIPILRLRDCSSYNLLKNFISRTSNPHIPLNLKISNSNLVTSVNWSGFVVGKDLFNPSSAIDTVKFVAGTWRVPTIKKSKDTTYCATWVGIDGFNNKTVEQIGTEQEFLVTNSFKGQFNYAWIEMFPQNAQIISGFPVEIGDLIRGSVEFMSNNRFNLSLVNKTKKVKTKIIKSLSNPAQRACAEWIVEAPFLNGVLPLGNFGKINFRNCKTKISGVRGLIENPNWQRLRINMTTNQGVLKASTSGLNPAGGAFSVTWHHR